MLLETKDGYVIIDHKMVRALGEEKLRVAYAVQLQCYRMAVEKATGKKVLQTFLHLPNQGVCLELKTP
jgi:ATP-dependent exoDNAse (exonuclease V) beta subunit